MAQSTQDSGAKESILVSTFAKSYFKGNPTGTAQSSAQLT
jgi:hypothetical protein